MAKRYTRQTSDGPETVTAYVLGDKDNAKPLWFVESQINAGTPAGFMVVCSEVNGKGTAVPPEAFLKEFTATDEAVPTPENWVPPVEKPAAPAPEDPKPLTE